MLEKIDHSFDKFLQVVENHPGLQIVHVDKERFGFMVNNTICEYTKVYINGALVVSVSAESTNKNNVLKTIKKLGLDEYENINYIKAIKRVLGWEEEFLK